ncbi:MAG: hypothetical protein ACXAD7_27240, partial [Candidatus Kariarchaeaceae archaeon]
MEGNDDLPKYMNCISWSIGFLGFALILVFTSIILEYVFLPLIYEIPGEFGFLLTVMISILLAGGVYLGVKKISSSSTEKPSDHGTTSTIPPLHPSDIKAELEEILAQTKSLDLSSDILNLLLNLTEKSLALNLSNPSNLSIVNWFIQQTDQFDYETLTEEEYRAVLDKYRGLL